MPVHMYSCYNKGTMYALLCSYTDFARIRNPPLQDSTFVVPIPQLSDFCTDKSDIRPSLDTLVAFISETNVNKIVQAHNQNREREVGQTLSTQQGSLPLLLLLLAERSNLLKVLGLPIESIRPIKEAKLEDFYTLEGISILNVALLHINALNEAINIYKLAPLKKLAIRLLLSDIKRMENLEDLVFALASERILLREFIPLTSNNFLVRTNTPQPYSTKAW